MRIASTKFRAMLVVSLGGVLVGLAPGAPASADATNVALCLLQSDGCLIDRYDLPPTLELDDDGGLGLVSPTQDPGTTSDSFPATRDAPNGSGVTFRGITGSQRGASGADISVSNPNVNNGRPYVPCKNTADPYYSACANPGSTNGSYFRQGGWNDGGGNPYPVGMLIPNTSAGLTHNWGKKMTRADLEFYVKDANGNTLLTYVRPRFTSNNEFASSPGGNGYNMTGDWGSIAERSIYDANVGRLNGYVYATSGVPAAAQRMYFSAFNSSFSSTASSSTGRLLGSFGVGTNLANGYHSTGAVYALNYNVHIFDTSNGHTCYIPGASLTSTGIRADFYLDRPGFGRSDTQGCNF